MKKGTKTALAIGSAILVGAGLYFALKPKKEEEYIEEFSEDSITPSTPKFPLRKGSKGYEVKTLQKAVNILAGECVLVEDGIWGGDTEKGLDLGLRKLKEYKPSAPVDKLYDRNGIFIPETFYNGFLKRYESSFRRSRC